MILPQQPPPFDIQFGEKIGPYVLGKTINELIFDLKVSSETSLLKVKLRIVINYGTKST